MDKIRHYDILKLIIINQININNTLFLMEQAKLFPNKEVIESCSKFSNGLNEFIDEVKK